MNRRMKTFQMRALHIIITALQLCIHSSAIQPNIIFILGDDIGWSDFSYNVRDSPIPTPYIDSMAKKGVGLTQYYTHSLCTPSRAALLTGKYHINTGLNFVLIPGSPAGLRDDMVTLPDILRLHANYSTSMVGKWHLGHAQRKLTPIGRGFQSFTGIYSWDTDSYTKQIYEEPWKEALMIDWVTEGPNGSAIHFSEPRHSTEAITAAAQEVIIQAAEKESPLFLYVAMTAAHSPLQPMQRHLSKCTHIPHLWRRQFCGMVVGLDESVKNITETALQYLGNNTLLVVTSDNGGSPWFGGMNAPLRGGKTTPFEGGVRVPALIVDFSVAANERQDEGRQVLFDGLMHVSDWFPTLAHFAGIPTSALPQDLDGVNLAGLLRPSSNDTVKDCVAKPRDSLLLEMWAAGDTPFGESLEAYRLGDYKLINGTIRDPNYYRESSSGLFLNISRPLWITYSMEVVIKCFEMLFGAGPFDTMRIILTHKVVHSHMLKDQQARAQPTLYLFNLRTDPTEANNLALNLMHPANNTLKELHELSAEDKILRTIMDAISERLHHIRRSKPRMQNVSLQMDFRKWRETAVPGDCSMNPRIKPSACRFSHPWINDSVDPWMGELVAAMDETEGRIRACVKNFFSWTILLLVSVWVISRQLLRKR